LLVDPAFRYVGGMRLGVLAGALLCAAAAARAAEEHPGYVVHASVPLSRRVDGVDGRLELLEDARFTSGLRAQFWGVQDAAMYCAEVYDSNRAFCTSAERAPIEPALLRVVDADGRELAVAKQERALSELRVERLRGEGGRPSYAVTIDYSVGMGSYAGPETRFAEIRNGRLVWLRSVDAQGKNPEPIRLATTLKSAWKIVPGKPAGTPEILQCASRPDMTHAAPGDASLPFVLELTRYVFDGARWRRYRRASPGFWESDAPFPERARFP